MVCDIMSFELPTIVFIIISGYCHLTSHWATVCKFTISSTVLMDVGELIVSNCVAVAIDNWLQNVSAT